MTHRIPPPPDGRASGACALTLDDVLEQAEAKWRAWRAEHPDAEVREHSALSDLGADVLMEEILGSVLRRTDGSPPPFALGERLWNLRLDCHAGTPGAAVLEAVERTVYEHINGIVQAEARASAATARLDALLDAAAEAGHQWVLDHPDVDLDSVEDEPNVLIWEAQREIAGSLVPDDAELIQQLACEPRVWSYQGDANILDPPLAHAAAMMLQEFVRGHLDELRRAVEPAPRPS